MNYINLIALIVCVYLAGTQQAYRGTSAYNEWEHYFFVCFAGLNGLCVAMALWGAV